MSLNRVRVEAGCLEIDGIISFENSKYTFVLNKNCTYQNGKQYQNTNKGIETKGVSNVKYSATDQTSYPAYRCNVRSAILYSAITNN